LGCPKTRIAVAALGGRGEEVGSLRHLGDAVAMACESDGALLTKMQSFPIYLRVVDCSLVLMVLTVLLEE
jgi:hypothetical protein